MRPLVCTRPSTGAHSTASSSRHAPCTLRSVGSRSSSLQCLKQRIARCSSQASSGPAFRASDLLQRQGTAFLQRSVCCQALCASNHQAPADDLREVRPAPDSPRYRRWDLISRCPLGGGVLEVVCWEGERCLRVWLPPGYSPVDAARQRYPVLYLNDGQNLFGDVNTLSGCSWDAANTAGNLITSGLVPPFIIVGIDHAGVLRSLEYTPVTPGTGPGGFRADAANWPGGGVDAYLDRVRNEIVPWVCSQYPASSEPCDMAFGGSSFGGIAALAAALKGPEACGFGALLVESPSLWIGDESFLQDILAYNINKGAWPERVYIGMGGREFSGTRGGAGREHDANFLRYSKALYASLAQQGGLGPDRLAWTVDMEAGHTESAWAARLPAALQFVAGGWWRRWQQRFQDQLFFTVPRRLKAGLSGQQLIFNRHNSHSLSGLPHGTGLKMVMGMNGWKNTVKLSMAPAGQVQQLQVQPPQQLQQEVWEQWRQEHQQLQKLREAELEQQRATAKQNLQDGASSDSASTQGDEPVAAASTNSSAGNEHRHHHQQQQQQHEQPSMDPGLMSTLSRHPANCSICGCDGDWWMVQLPPLPPDCYELNVVFSDEAGSVYDNNGNNDFYIAVRQLERLEEVTPVQHSNSCNNGSSSTYQNRGGITAGGRGSGTVAAAAAATIAARTTAEVVIDVEVDAEEAAVAAAAAAAAAAAEAEAAEAVVEAAAAAAAGDACGFADRDVFAAAIAAAAAGANAPADTEAAAAASRNHLFFTLPPCPVAGAPVTLYCNRARLAGGLPGAPNLKLQFSFNDWQMGVQQLDLKPTSLWRGEGVDFWSVQLLVPSEAVLADFVFTAECNGGKMWDNNWGHDYHLPVRSVAAAAVAAAAEAALAAMDEAPPASASDRDPDRAAPRPSSSSSRWQARPPPPPPPGFAVRSVESVEAVPHAGGMLEVIELDKRSGGASGSSKRQRWWDEKRIRVWLPPGFSPDAAPAGGWPAIVMTDGANMFEDWLAHQGVSWNLGHTAAGLISVGAIPSCVCVAIDSAGPYRSYNYLPFPPGTGEGGFRGDAARWPGGGAHDFLMRVHHEILPMLTARYNLAQCPSRLAFGGGSFAGVTALMAAIHLPHVFGGILVESPSLWAGEGRFLQDLAKYSGRLPERLALGCGTREYSATRDHERPDVDYLLLSQYHEAARLLQERGLRGCRRFKFLVEDGAGHHEGAWRWRLSGALEFLAQGWWDS